MGKKSRIKRERRAENISGKMLKKFGTFKCQKCRKLLPRSANKRGQPRKYCEECAKSLKTHTNEKYYCINCGKEIEHNSVTQRIHKRCATCQDLFGKFLKKFPFWCCINETFVLY